MRNGYVYRLSPWTTSSLSALSGANDERRLPCDMTTESLACPILLISDTRQKRYKQADIGIYPDASNAAQCR